MLPPLLLNPPASRSGLSSPRIGGGLWADAAIHPETAGRTGRLRRVAGFPGVEIALPRIRCFPGLGGAVASRHGCVDDLLLRRFAYVFINDKDYAAHNATQYGDTNDANKHASPLSMAFNEALFRRRANSA